MEKPGMNPEIDTLRKQLQQLQELHGGGALDDEQYQQSKARLERKLVDAVVQPATAGAATAAPADAAAPATAAAVPPGPAAPTAAAAKDAVPAGAAPAVQPQPAAKPAATKPAAAAATAKPAAAASTAAGAAGLAAAQPRPSRRLLAGVGVFVVAITVAGYAWKGTPSQLGLGTQASAGAPAGHAGGDAPHDVGNAQIAAMVEKLAQRMKERPDDAQGWVMLARSYTVLERYADAVPAYAAAVKLVGDDASLLADYADVLGMTNGRILGTDAMQLIERALKADANNLKALSLAGSAAFTGKDYATAVRYWERLVEVAPAESPFLPDVRSGIAEARELGKLGQAPAGATSGATGKATATLAAAPAPTPAPAPATQVAQAAPKAPAADAPPAAAGPATVSGTITLSKSLAAQASPNDTVFIFARAAEGPRMPLAIVRKQVKDLPFEFKLDDSHAMAPAFKLSSFPKVVVGARISKSGEAMPQKGDLTGLSAPVATGSTGLKIEINQVVNP
jgi:cytochrome c-type biogenesis protein CcmH